MRDRLPAYLAVAFAIMVWGASFVAARALLHPGAGRVALSPTHLAALRFSIASCVLCVPVIVAVLRRRLSLIDLLKLALLGQLAFSLYFWLQYTGVEKTNASIASILVIGLLPLAATLLGRFMGEARFGGPRYVALALGLVGACVISLQHPLNVSLRSGFLFGSLCLISNAVAFAVYSHLSKRWMRGMSPLVLTGGTMTAGALGLLLISAFDGTRWSDVSRLSGQQWASVLYLAIACSLLGFLVFNYALTKIDASQATTYLYMEPVVTVVFAIVLLGESLTWQTLVGAALIALSVVGVTALSPSPPGREEVIRIIEPSTEDVVA
jgi:drug/metabolite transporter (DMT)-like permease